MEQMQFTPRESYLSCMSPKSDRSAEQTLESAGPSGGTEQNSLTSFESIGLDDSPRALRPSAHENSQPVTIGADLTDPSHPVGELIDSLLVWVDLEV